ncbi:MAG: alpha/beta hydrolase family protein [Flavobacteriales bacterium]
MNITRNNILEGKHQKPILLDFGFKPTQQQKPIVVIAHGFKGFKDWGHFNKVMEYFIENNFAFVKFNFSHNGGSPEQPIDFPDLEAFGNNNYTKELDDLKTIVNWIVETDSLPTQEVNKNQIYLIGHSRGGGISIIGASEDKRIKKLVTWAAVSDFLSRLPQDLTTWKTDGVLYVENTRTHQQMPMYYQFVEDNLNNKERLNIRKSAEKLNIPHLIIHGTNDEVVHVTEAHNLKKWNLKSELFLLEGGTHTFGAKHPFNEIDMPNDVQLALRKTLAFLR